MPHTLRPILPAAIALLLYAGACTPVPQQAGLATTPQPPAQLPTGRLPTDVKPLAYTLELTIRPAAEQFSGRTQIAVEIAQPTQRIWLHGMDLTVSSAVVVVEQQRIAADYRQLDKHGLAEVTVAAPLPAGQAIVEITYSAPFDRNLAGLYKVVAGGESYAFTQFEPYSARKAFPCFDEPAHKTTFDVWLTIEPGQVAIANTPLLAEEDSPEGLRRLHFAPTKPLPTYLIAFAVGPLEVVEAPPIAANAVRGHALPFRGVAIKGKGPQLAYALAHTPPLLAELERYFGLPYPYEKLDVIAVPDFGAGAMENAGAITFREWLLLLDSADAPEYQRRAFAQVMAHELAHHWFGDLVTMPWWDDIWLNEAFATWMGHHVVGTVHPEYQSKTDLLSAVHNAMRADSRLSARRIRQPIENTHDITSAFDSITYQKGAAVLGMFESYIGPEVFRRGLAEHLSAYAHGVADSEALLAGLSKAANKDVAAPFRSFLDQVGVPLITAELHCDGEAALHLSQTRYVPAGSPLRDQAQAAATDAPQAAPVWQVPVCARYGTRREPLTACTLLTQPTGVLPLGKRCPRWVMPNAGGSGYYRFALAAPDLENLQRRGFSKLEQTEKLALIDSLKAGFQAGSLNLPDVFSSFPTLVKDSSEAVASAPMSLLRFARERLLSPDMLPGFQRTALTLYAPLLKRLGWKERANEDGETRVLRANVIGFLSETADDASTRASAAEIGREVLGFGGDGALHMDKVPADLRGIVIDVALADGDVALYDHAYAHFTSTQDSVARDLLLGALASVRDERSTRALQLALDPALRGNEVMGVLHRQMADERTREAAFQWLQDNFDAFAARMSPSAAGSMPWLGRHFCDEVSAQRVEAFFKPRVEALSGGPRSLSGVLEMIRQCAAQVAIHKSAAAAYFGQ